MIYIVEHFALPCMFYSILICVCTCACVHACVRVCVCVCVFPCGLITGQMNSMVRGTMGSSPYEIAFGQPPHGTVLLVLWGRLMKRTSRSCSLAETKKVAVLVGIRVVVLHFNMQTE